MKTLYTTFFISLSAFVLSACSGKPSEGEFTTMIAEVRQYPISRDKEFALNNRFYIDDLRELDLEAQGYIKIDESSSRYSSEDKQCIHFTDKAKPFLIGEPYTTDERFPSINQKVAAYKIVFKGITGVKFNKDENKAIVLYDEVYQEVSPFANLFKEKQQHIKEGDILSQMAYFSKYEDGWRLETNPGMEFISF